jgi:hypothetical protein
MVRIRKVELTAEGRSKLRGRRARQSS